MVVPSDRGASALNGPVDGGLGHGVGSDGDVVAVHGPKHRAGTDVARRQPVAEGENGAVFGAGGVGEDDQLAFAVLVGLGARDVEDLALGVGGQVLDAHAG
jgi:hypothetical protein